MVNYIVFNTCTIEYIENAINRGYVVDGEQDMYVKGIKFELEQYKYFNMQKKYIMKRETLTHEMFPVNLKLSSVKIKKAENIEKIKIQ